MPLKRVLTLLMCLLALALFVQVAYWWPQLPERIASHFDLDNRVNGWMSRTEFLAVTLGLDVFMAGMFLVLPLLLEKIPDALINLPHKDYWLAPPHRAESLAHMASGLLAIGCTTLLLLLVIFQGLFALNAEIARGTGGDASGSGAVAAPDLSTPFLPLMGAYLFAMMAVVTWMLWRFRKPK